MQSIRSWTSRMDFGVLSFQNLHITSSLRKINKLKYVAYDQPLMWHMGEHQNRMLTLASHAYLQGYQSDSTATTSMSGLQKRSLMINALHSRQALFPLSVNHLSSYRAYSSLGGSKPDGLREAEVSSAATSRESAFQNTDSVGNDWLDMLNQACLSAVDVAVDIGKKTKEASEELVPYIQQLFDSHPYLKDVIVPVGGTLSAAVLAWVVMPRILRKLHMYGSPGPVAVLSGNSKQQIPYEASFWSALENPARYLTIFMAFTQLGVMIAPTTSQYLPQAWRGAVVISFVWFLHRWKSNVITRALANQVTIGLDQDKLMALDKLSSVGLLVLGTIALAEACGVAVQSILTVGGIGGVATAFAARDILGNVLSGLSLQFIKPFSIGDNIKAGSIEGQVVEMGLTTISLINSEKFPITAPNSLFSSQVILNKSRAQWRAIEMKIPVRIDDLEKIPLVAENIKSMLSSNPKVVLGKEAPYCYLSRIENFYAELTIGCNLKNMRKDEFYSTEQEILLKAAQIIKQNGAELGSSTLLSH